MGVDAYDVYNWQRLASLSRVVSAARVSRVTEMATNRKKKTASAPEKSETLLIRVAPEMLADWRELAAKLDRPLSQVIREAMVRYSATMAVFE